MQSSTKPVHDRDTNEQSITGGKGPSLAARAALALGLMLGFYLLAIAIALGLLLLVYAEWQVTGIINARIAIFSLLGTGALMWSIIPRREKFVAPGARLDEKAQPQLFQTIRGIAGSTGQEMPAEVYLIPDVNAWVARG
ncbi:MAG: hypothetical protein ABI670_03785 [Chloroflexota bacterium]